MGRDAPASRRASTWRRALRWLAGAPGVAAFAVALALGAGGVLDLRARRAEPATRAPTAPAAAAGREREMGFASGGIRLAGTLTLPPGPGPFPAVFLISGSGAQDRDAELFGHPRHRVLAEALTRAGVAVLRADDRGVGDSTGDLALATQADLASDAWAAVRLLRDQPEIDPGRVGLYGASQGSTIAPLVAVEHPGEVAFVILAAAISRPLREVFISQHVRLARALGLPETTVREIGETVEEVTRVIVSEATEESKRARLRPLAERLDSSLRADPVAGLSPFGDSVDRAVASALTPAMRDLLSHDPGPRAVRPARRRRPARAPPLRGAPHARGRVLRPHPLARRLRR